MAFLDILQAIAKYSILALLTYLFSVDSYRLLFHPLARYPGPLLAKVSDLYGGLGAFSKELHIRTWHDHTKYGPIIRQGPNKLVFNSVQAAIDIYQNDNVLKSQCYQDGNMDPSTTNVFNTINPQVHRLKRRLVGQLLTPTSIRSLEPIITEQVDLFVKQLSTTSATKTGAESAVNMSRRCKYLGLDIAALLAFGYNLRLQTEEEHRYLPRAIARGSWIINLYMQFRFLKTIKFGIPIYVPAIIKGEAFLPTLRKMIKARLAEDRYARVDLYSHLADALQASGDEKITLSELWAEAIFFLPAAGDTSSTALSSLFFYLARNPECQKTVAKEIRSTFTAGDDIKSGQKLANCQYLHACINEALRLSPPVAGTVWREQSLESAKEPLIIDGRVIPQGTQVGVNIYSIHHNPDYFPEPFAYKPERWLPSSSTESSEKASNTAAFMPFGAGSRACAGKPLAYLEVAMALAKTLWYFDFDFAQSVDTSGSNHDTEFRLKDVFTSDHDGPFLQFTPRGDFYKEL